MEDTKNGWWSRRWVVRHWRGELSLSASLGLNGVATLPLFWVAWQVALAPSETVVDVRPVLVRLAAVVAGTTIVAVWQVGGIWRASARSRNLVASMVRLGLVIVGFAATFGVVTVAQLFLGLRQLYRSQRAFDGYSVSFDPATTTVTASGPIGVGWADAVTAQFSEHPDAGVLILTSYGGLLGEAYRVVPAIETRVGVTIRVSKRCDSACTIVLMAGKKRELIGDARVGFHNPNPIVPVGVHQAIVESWRTDCAQYLKDHGLPDAFVRSATELSGDRRDRLLRPPASELFRVGVITAVVVDDVPLNQREWNEWNLASKLDHVRASALASALRQLVPEELASAAEADANLRPGDSPPKELPGLVRVALLASVPRAPDAAVFALLSDRLGLLTGLDERSCARYVAGALSLSELPSKLVDAAGLHAVDTILGAAAAGTPVPVAQHRVALDTAAAETGLHGSECEQEIAFARAVRKLPTERAAAVWRLAFVRIVSANADAPHPRAPQ